jgi:hypothetical protein
MTGSLFDPESGLLLGPEETERLQRWAELRANLEQAARETIMSALEKDGASPKSAEAAAVEIANDTLFYRDLRERGIDTMTEMMELAKALNRIRELINGLTPEGRVTVEALLRRSFTPGLLSKFAGGALRRTIDPLAAFKDFEGYLPYIIARLPEPRAKKPSHDPALHSLIHSTAQTWRETTGQWPSAQRRPEDGSASAPLYAFLSGHSGGALSPSTWARALQKVKSNYGHRGVLGRVRAMHTKPTRRRSSAKAADE